MIARPVVEWSRLVGLPQLARNIAIRIKNADRRNVDRGKPLLPSCLAWAGLFVAASGAARENELEIPVI
jgi:hypothetical protein